MGNTNFRRKCVDVATETTALDQESVVTPMVAVDVMCDVADALRSKLNMPKVNQDYSM